MIAYTVMVPEFTFPLLRYLDSSTTLTAFDSTYYRVFVAGLAVCVLPTLLLRDLTMLGKISTVASFCILLLAIMTSAAVATSDTDKPLVDNPWPMLGQYNFFDVLGSTGTVLFAMFNVSAIPDLHQSLQDKSQMLSVAVLGNLTCLIFYLWVTIPVYLLTGTRQCKCDSVAVEGGKPFSPINTLYVHLFSRAEDGPTSLLLIVIASLGVAINVGASIPIYHFVLRTRSYQLYRRLQGLLPLEDPENMPWKFFGLHTALYLLVAGVALAMPDVIFFLDFVGSIAGSSFLFIVPALMAMTMNGGVKHNLSYTVAEREGKCNVKYMLFLNFILYFGGMIFLNSFYILVTAILKKANE